jgi:hypothetical protein
MTTTTQPKIHDNNNSQKFMKTTAKKFITTT